MQFEASALQQVEKLLLAQSGLLDDGFEQRPLQVALVERYRDDAAKPLGVFVEMMAASDTYEDKAGSLKSPDTLRGVSAGRRPLIRCGA